MKLSLPRPNFDFHPAVHSLFFDRSCRVYDGFTLPHAHGLNTVRPETKGGLEPINDGVGSAKAQLKIKFFTSEAVGVAFDDEQ